MNHPSEDETPLRCSRHLHMTAVSTCAVCGQPICERCMELFGYICSPKCRHRARELRMEIPEYAGQRSVIERREQRCLNGRLAGVALAIVSLLGAWIWYAWVASVPRTKFSVRFDQPALSGQSCVCPGNQVVFLHGTRLARYDLKSRKEVWGRELVDKSALTELASKLIAGMTQANTRMQFEGAGKAIEIPTIEEQIKELTRETGEALELRLSGTNLWVVSPGKLTRHDWSTGKPAQEVALTAGLDEAVMRDGEILLPDLGSNGQQLLTRINLNNGEVRKEAIGEWLGGSMMAPASAAPSGALNPQRIASQVQSMPLPARLALPATLSLNIQHQRLLDEMAEQDGDTAPETVVEELATREGMGLVPGPEGFVQFSSRVVKKNIVAQSAMRPRPAKSALDGPINAAATADIANEILNDLQRSKGGDIVYDDQSTYAVTVRVGRGVTDWSGEVIGPPELHSLKTVNVVTAGRSVIVLDQKNRKMFEATLGHSVNRDSFPVNPDPGDPQGPCVEREGVLYIADAGALSAFDLATGQVRWRLPSVGIEGIFFDEQGMVYLNSTIAGVDTLKYSRQIDVTAETGAVVHKVNPKNGQKLWSREDVGTIACISGKFIYTMVTYRPLEEETPLVRNPSDRRKPPFVKIKRLHPRNGNVMWEHVQQRVPLDAQFDRNTIQLVFKKEVQVLSFLSF